MHAKALSSYNFGALSFSGTITYQWGRSWWGRLVSESGVRLYLTLMFKYRHYRTRKWALAACPA
jgi:hypothetical protein